LIEKLPKGSFFVLENSLRQSLILSNSGLSGRDYLLSLEKESSKETSKRQRKTKRQKPTQREIRQK